MFSLLTPFSLFGPFRAPLAGGVVPAPDIGIAGTAGFGVGVYQGDLSTLGLLPLAGYDDPSGADYGNYLHIGGSIVCFVPKYYYRIGSASSPRYATYGLNCIDIASANAFADEAAANAAGYALHRAFKDGGTVKSGFFVDKYLASKDGTGLAAVSVKDAAPISLTWDAAYTPSQGMAGCAGILADAITLSRARGAGWNCNSIFIWDALAKLSLAHGQAATGSAACAWYDASGTTNFPKGCNNNALRDVNDATVLYTTAGDSGAAAKGRTGSGTPFAKTTHNGQACGVADLNGLLWEVLLGLTNPGSSATSSTQILNGDAWVLKPSVALADLTSGFGAGSDAWGGATHLAGLYDFYEDFLPWASATDWVRFGNGSAQVFSADTSGIDYLRACCGLPATIDGFSAGGTNLFGVDGNYRYNRANLFPLAGANWGIGSYAGVVARSWNSYRSYVNTYVGFRAAAYGV